MDLRAVLGCDRKAAPLVIEDGEEEIEAAQKLHEPLMDERLWHNNQDASPCLLDKGGVGSSMPQWFSEPTSSARIRGCRRPATSATMAIDAESNRCVRR